MEENMKTRSLLALLLAALVLVGVFSACIAEETPVNSDDPAGNVTGDTGENGDDDADNEGEIVEIDFWWTDNGSTGSGAKAELVEEAINAITEKEIGVHVNMVWIASADYPTQVNLSVANQESFDVGVYTPGIAGSFLTYYTNGVLMDITDLLDAHGQEIKELFGEEILKMTTVDGKIYGLSTYRLLNSSMYLCIRRDVLENAGLMEQAENMTSWAEYEAVMQAIRDSGQDAYPFGSSNAYGLIADPGAIFCGDKFTDSLSYDVLGDSLYVVFSDQEGNVSLLQDQPEFVEQCKMVREWNDAGYVWPDTAYNQDGSEVYMGQGVFASYISQSEFGIEVNKTQQIGTEVLCVQLFDNYLSTTQGQKFGIFIPSTSQEPEAAMRFISLLYTSKELMNLYIYGVQGETYELVDGVGQYPEGTDSSTCGYHAMDFTLGNQFLVYPWAPLGADFRDKAMANFLNCQKSRYIGFTVDTGDYSTLMAGITSVVNEYMKQITGGLYTDEMYDEFMEKLDSAKIDEWIGIYQSALTDWLA